MQLKSIFFGLAAIATSTTNAQAGTIIKVTVGHGGVLQYSPNNITAAVGTSIEFDFFPKNHSVIQSSFANPCHPLAGGGFFSGFVPTQVSPSGTSFTIIVNNTKPVWFYCGQTTGNHCQSGMVGSINAPTSGNTLAAFIELAKSASISTAPPGGIVGGTLKTSTETTSSSASSTTSSTASSSASSSASSLTSSTSLSAPTTSSIGAASGMNVFGAGGVLLAALGAAAFY